MILFGHIKINRAYSKLGVEGVQAFFNFASLVPCEEVPYDNNRKTMNKT